MAEERGRFDFLDELNPDQRRAVTHGEGPLLIVAGAGTGKTRTLAYRVAYLIATGVEPTRVLLLTFTRRAAEEMLRRAGSVVARGTTATGRVWGGTFHATANRLLHLYAKAAGLARDFTVMDQGDAEDMIDLVRHELGLARREKRFPRKATCLSIYSRTVNGSESLESVLRRDFPWCAEWEVDLRTLFRRYVERKQDHRLLDYDDLLLYWATLVREPIFARELSSRFDHLLVDEYQDTNPVQADILVGMREGKPNLTVVGDDAQSIYGFRAATVRNMLDFPVRFPGTTIVTLEQNYRSVVPILETTNRVIAQARERYSKALWSERREGARPRLVVCRDERDQDDRVIASVLEHYEAGIPLREQAVLFRAGHLSGSLEIELTRRGIPYQKYGGLRFLEAAHVKDLVAFLRILENPRDEMAWFRALQILDGVGPSTAARVLRHVGDHRFDPRSLRDADVPPAAREGLGNLAALFSDLLGKGPLPPASQVERIRRFYQPYLERIYENPGPRGKDLDSLERIADGYRTRSRFLVDLQLDPPSSTADLAGPPRKDEDWLVLSTIHSAKGCEWRAVHLIHAADGFLPSDLATGSSEEIEEELRLTYVALTRAKDFLCILFPLRYYHRRYALGDGHVYAQLSRFFTPDVLKTVDQEWPDAGGPPGADLPEEGGLRRTVDLAEEIRKRWD